MTAGGSPALQAKKQERDAKRKKLEAMFDQHKKHEQALVNNDDDTEMMPAGEAPSEQTAPSYLKGSYQQHPSVQSDGDIEQGGEQDAKNTTATPKLSNSYGSSDMRAEVQSLIRNDLVVDDEESIYASYTVLEKIKANPQRFFMAICAFLLMLWWM